MADRTTPPSESASQSSPELEQAVAAMIETVDRLDELGLEAVEPATTFGWAG